ncbi:Trigger factor [Mycoplasmopsis citelli]|uniref:Trigger factor n=1 Tax=Mycoplasmopsis citelli TaxID=171281 RepID=A0A449B1W2_9BACT|nr:trigger factor [Mycoplasmopsis citelli]VEU74566.1 Trigger factor [Mycoplasmopsis citelli]
MFDTKLNKENQEYIVTLTLDKEEYDKEFQKNYKNALSKVKIPGFRPGKAPKHKLEAAVNTGEVHSQTLDFFIKNKHFEVAKKAQEQKEVTLLPLAPVVEINKDENENWTLSYKYSLMPDLSVLKLEDVKAKLHLKEVSDEDVTKVMQEFTKPFSSRELFDLENNPQELTKIGDVVNIDFKGFIDNEPFEGGEAQGYELELGSKAFIPGFEDQLLNKKAGDQVDVKVAFPADYYVETFRNKEAIFEVKLHSFTRVKHVEFTEELIKQLALEGVKTLEQAKEFFKQREILNAFTKSSETFLDEVNKDLANQEELKVAHFLLENKYKELEKNFNDSLKNFGVKKHEYFKLVKSNDDKLKAELMEAAQKEVKLQLANEYLIKNYSPEQTTDEEIKDLEFKFSLIDNEFKKRLVWLKKFLEAILKVVDEKSLPEFEKAYSQLLK